MKTPSPWTWCRRRCDAPIWAPSGPATRWDLERSLAVDGRFGGHVVQGHVDSTGAIESVAQEGEALLLRFRAPPSIMRYVVEKGFIAVTGSASR